MWCRTRGAPFLLVLRGSRGGAVRMARGVSLPDTKSDPALTNVPNQPGRVAGSRRGDVAVAGAS
jgi:hypothetical protein